MLHEFMSTGKEITEGCEASKPSRTGGMVLNCHLPAEQDALFAKTATRGTTFVPCRRACGCSTVSIVRVFPHSKDSADCHSTMSPYM